MLRRRRERLLAEWDEVAGWEGQVPFPLPARQRAQGMVIVYRVYQYARSGGVKAVVDIGDGRYCDVWFQPEVGGWARPGWTLFVTVEGRWGDHNQNHALNVVDVFGSYDDKWTRDVGVARRWRARRNRGRGNGQ